MNRPTNARSIFAWSAFGFAIAAALAATVLWRLNAGSDGVFPPQIFVVPGFGLVGAIVTARSRNAIGPLFLGLAIVGAATAFTFGYAVRALGTAPGTLPLGGYAGALSNAGFPFTFLALGWTLLLFPDGRLPARRWRPIAWSLTIVWGLTTILSLFATTLDLGEFQDLPNPLGIGGPTKLVTYAIPLVTFAWTVTAFLLLAATAAAPLFRRQRANQEARQQLRWFGLVLEATLALAVIAFALAGMKAESALAVVSVAMLLMLALGLPGAIGVAILKYHLFDLDVIISKAVVYGALAAFITLVYVGVVVGIGALFGQGGHANVGLSIIATAVVAVGFQPVRERMTRVANRLVYGERATPYQVLSEFAEQVGSTYAAEDVLPRTARVIAEGTGAERADVWLRIDNELRLAASWPSGDGAVRVLPLPADGASLPEIGGVDRAVPVLLQGSLLGAVTVTKSAGDPLRHNEEVLLDDLASQAGLVLANARLTAELSAHLDELTQRSAELRRSRQRIVTAQDEERRRLERNIHDGAQQHLVALAVKLRLAKSLVTRDPGKATHMLTELRGEVDDALETLSNLALGIYPPLLEEQGIATALAAQYQRMDIPVRLHTSGGARYPIDLEAAVYFCTLEALQNIAKYANATSVDITIDERDGALGFEVTDDGAGFDLSLTARGSGLNNMADRLETLGGAVTIQSHPGRGTTVRGHVPLRDGARAEVGR